MDCVVAPFDHTLSVGEEDVSTILPPSQKVVAPLAVIVGTAGTGFTVMEIVLDTAEVQPADVSVTLYVPAVVTVIDCVVAPFDQRFPVEADEVSTTFPPAQKVVEPAAVITGVAGRGFTVTLTGAEAADGQPETVDVTEYDPVAVTVMDCVVAPFDHRFPVEADEVSTTLPPAQKLRGPPAEIVGVAGVGVTVTFVAAEAGDVQPETVAVTV